MKQLYHRLTIDKLFNIIKSNSFFLMPSNHSGRGGKYYASLSRHKNNIEGFDPIFYAEGNENCEVRSYATITFNIPKLTRVHGISIVPFDFYGTHDEERTMVHGRPVNPESSSYKNDNIYSKMVYQKLDKMYREKYKKDDEYDDEDYDDYDYEDYDDTETFNESLKRNINESPENDEFYDAVCDYDEPEYYNMAEENIVSDTIKEIPYIYNYIDRIDIYFPFWLLDKQEEYNPYSGEFEMMTDWENKRSCDYAFALCMVICGTEWENKVIVNLSSGKKDKGKTMSMSEFYEWLKSKNLDKKHENAAKKLFDKKPLSWDKCQDEYSNDYDDYGHGHGHH